MSAQSTPDLTANMTANSPVEDDLLKKLNAAQAEAVSLGWGPSLVIAGAGSGKTTVLTRRIAYLISRMNQDPESVLSVTFTNKAAAEMKHRVEALVGYDVARRIFIGTFHSISARILRREIEEFSTPEGWKWSRNFVIYDESDSVSVLKGAIRKLNLDEKVFAAKEIKYAISAVKNDGQTASAYTKVARTYRETRIAEIYNVYQGELARNNALDFDDLILVFNELLRTNPAVLKRLHDQFHHILVDEFQDTNKSQYDLIQMLSVGSFDTKKVTDQKDVKWQERSLMVVGDVDQSIYSWRKADFRIILGFQNDFSEGKLIKLEENYRSTSTILEVANSIIENNSERIEKVLRCNRGKGGKAQCFEAADEIDEAYYVVEELKRLQARGKNLADCVILYRTNAQSRAIEEILVRSHVPYTVVGGTRFYERQEIKDILAYLKLIYNERDGQAFNRVVNVPRRGLGKTTLDRVSEYADEYGLTMIDAARSALRIPEVSDKSAKALMEFASHVSRWHMLSTATPVSTLLEMVLKDIGYIEKLEEDVSSAKDELALGRIENVRELVAVAKEFEQVADEPDLDSFLTRISLVSDLDAIKEGQDAIKLMTLHSAKGLEFPVVFLMGLEEGLFPHIRSFDSNSAMEEERRLMYVGVTRAGDLLYLTFARRRMMIGRNPREGGSFSSAYTIPSRFLKEIGEGLVAGYYPSPQANPTEEETTSSGEDWDENNRFSSHSSKPANQFGRLTGSGLSSQPKPQGARPPVRMPATNSGALRSSRQEDSEPFEHLKVGDTVQHLKFGVGKVTGVIGEKDKELYNVEFGSGAGKRLLDPRYAKLTKL